MIDLNQNLLLVNGGAMFQLMKEIFNETSNSFLEWRFENFRYWYEKIPELVEKAFLRNDKVELLDLDLTDSDPKTYYGYNPLNIKVLTLKTKAREENIQKLYIPVPGPYDIFNVNSMPYILIAEMIDQLITVYDQTIRLRYFKIENDSFIFNRTHYPLAKFLVTIGYYDKSDFEVVSEVQGPNDVDTGKCIIRFKKYKGTPFDKMVVASLQKVKTIGDLFDPSLRNRTNQFDIGTYYIYQLNLFYDLDIDYSETTCDILCKWIRKAEEMFNTDLRFSSFGDVSQKYISYYDIIVEYLLKRVIDTTLQRRGLVKFRTDPNSILKWLVASNPRFQLVQSFENVFREVNMKETVVININNPPDRYRTVDPSYLYTIDPINTPDNEKMGIVQRVSKTVKLDQLGRFIID